MKNNKPLKKWTLNDMQKLCEKKLREFDDCDGCPLEDFCKIDMRHMKPEYWKVRNDWNNKWKSNGGKK